MKRWLIGGIAVLLILITAGVFMFWGNCAIKNESKTLSNVLYFKDTQYRNNDAVIQVYAVGDSFTKITYKIDNGSEIEFSGAVIDTVKKDWEFYDKAFEGKKYIDSRVQTIDLSSYEVGDHFISIYVYEGSSTKEEIYKNFFKLVE